MMQAVGPKIIHSEIPNWQNKGNLMNYYQIYLIPFDTECGRYRFSHTPHPIQSFGHISSTFRQIGPFNELRPTS